MPYYEFENEDGERLEVYREMSEAPGETIEHDGQTWKRVWSFQPVVKEGGTKGRLGSTSLPRNWPFAKKFDSAGRPLFENKRERDEAHARAVHAGEMFSKSDLSAPGQQVGKLIHDD